MSDPARRLIVSIFGCVCFGYAAASCLIFYRRMRERAAQYSGQPLEDLVHSRHYGWTIWITGAIGVVGFAISSWQAVISAIALLHTG